MITIGEISQKLIIGGVGIKTGGWKKNQKLIIGGGRLLETREYTNTEQRILNRLNEGIIILLLR